MSDTALLKAYRGASRALGPVLPLWIKRRGKHGKEDPSRTAEREGIASHPRPNGSLVWMHGASVGECTMLLPLIAKLTAERPDINMLITSGTMTAAKLLETRLPANAVHQYVPLDHPKYVARFIAHWKPDVAIWAESEIWPNLIKATKDSGAKLALLNARMSEKSIEGWTKRKASAAAIFAQFDLILAADEMTGNSLSWILDKDVETSGNLKDAAPVLPVDKAELAAFKKALPRRKVWCAASTHDGEDDIMLRAHKTLLARSPSAVLILAPRHPERADDIITLIRDHGLSFAQRSKAEMPTADTQVYLLDTIGDMGLAYRLAKMTFVCGSTIAGLSGHNPLEPARLGSAVMTGAHIASFAESYMSMFKYSAAKRVMSPDAIAREIVDIMMDRAALTALQKQGQHFATGRDDVLAYVWDQLGPLLPERIT
ncbi:3-deoxy-D-manno-octulosonic acid transferase [Fretibacter rubidus]|uniref:3-deoxy-D-manno-octulosonic acid transferase n=1 Tax=Fretibacter rubidus TaxID=570162 RepID=UPI00352A2F60